MPQTLMCHVLLCTIIKLPVTLPAFPMCHLGGYIGTFWATINKRKSLHDMLRTHDHMGHMGSVKYLLLFIVNKAQCW